LCEIRTLDPPRADQFRLRVTGVIQSESPWTVIEYVSTMPKGGACMASSLIKKSSQARGSSTSLILPAVRENQVRQHLSTDRDGIAANNLDRLPVCQ
jgi:hypothetical protein